MGLTDSEQKSEPATPRRLRELRARGDVVRTKDLLSALLLLVGLTTLAALALPLAASIERLAQSCLSLASQPRLEKAELLSAFTSALEMAARWLAPPLVVMACAAILLEGLLVGPGIHFAPLRPRVDRLNPLTGVRRLFFTAEGLVELSKSLLKAALVFSATFLLLRSQLGALLDLGTGNTRAAGWQLAKILARLAIWIATAMLFLSLGDHLWQRSRFALRSRMSRREVEEEARQEEGDSAQRAELRRLHRTLSEEQNRGAMRDSRR